MKTCTVKQYKRAYKVELRKLIGVAATSKGKVPWYARREMQQLAAERATLKCHGSIESRAGARRVKRLKWWPGRHRNPSFADRLR